MRHFIFVGLALASVIAISSRAFGQQAESDPIGALALDMEEVVLDLAAMTTGEPTQETQKQIVGKLDKIIEELESESESMRGGASGNNPQKPLPDSQITGGPGGIGDLHAARREGKQWAELPPHERDRILQSMSEGFPAHYQKILERYYKRLAEEQPVSAETDAAVGSDAADDAAAEEKGAPKQPAAKQSAGKSAAAAKRPAAKKEPAKPVRSKATGNDAAKKGAARSGKSPS